MNLTDEDKTELCDQIRVMAGNYTEAIEKVKEYALLPTDFSDIDGEKLTCIDFELVGLKIITNIDLTV